jgi:hypothetical protein
MDKTHVTNMLIQKIEIERLKRLNQELEKKNQQF